MGRYTCFRPPSRGGSTAPSWTPAPCSSILAWSCRVGGCSIGLFRVGLSCQVHLDVQTGLQLATFHGGVEGNLPSCSPNSSEDVDDAGELPPVLELHSGGGGAVGQASCGAVAARSAPRSSHSHDLLLCRSDSDSIALIITLSMCYIALACVLQPCVVYFNTIF